MSSYEELKSEIASDVLSEIDHAELAQNIDAADVASYLDTCDIAAEIEIDPADVNWEEVVGNVLQREYDVNHIVQDAMKMQADDITALHKQIDDLRYQVSALRETVSILDRKLARPWWKFWG